MRKTLLASLMVSLLLTSNSSNASDEDITDLSSDIQLSEKDAALIGEIQQSSKKVADAALPEAVLFSEKAKGKTLDETERKRAIYALKDSLDADSYEALMSSLVNNEENSKTLSENNYPVYIFVSQSMGDAALKTLYEAVAGEDNVNVVFRGILPGESLGDFSKRQRKLFKPEEDESSEATFLPPNIQINPVLFRQYQVTDVPQIIIADPDHMHKKSSCLKVTDTNNMGVTEACYVSRISGLTNYLYLLEEKKHDRIGDFGKNGDVVAIAEPDMAEEMKKRAMAYDWQSAADRARDNFFRHRETITLPTAIYKKIRYVDPTYTVPENITDSFGKVLIPKGFMINPLDQVSMTESYVVFNAANKQEVKRVQEYVANHSDDTFVFMISDIYHDDSSTGWEEYENLVKTLKQHVFLMPKNLPYELSIKVTPTVVKADNEKKILVLEELGTINTPKQNITVEQRYQYD